MYVRAVKRACWEALAAGGDAAIEVCVRDLTRSGSLVSVYECHSPADVELVAVALSVRRQPQKFHFVAIDPEDLAEAAITPIRSAGATVLPDANRLHCDIDLSGDRARNLVALLAERRIRVHVISEWQLCASARKLLDAGQPIEGDSWLLR